jgi:hypothetical protein
MVGHLTDANRLDLIRLYVAAVGMDVEGVVDQLLRMGSATGRVGGVPWCATWGVSWISTRVPR